MSLLALFCYTIYYRICTWNYHLVIQLLTPLEQKIPGRCLMVKNCSFTYANLLTLHPILLLWTVLAPHFDLNSNTIYSGSFSMHQMPNLPLEDDKMLRTLTHTDAQFVSPRDSLKFSAVHLILVQIFHQRDSSLPIMSCLCLCFSALYSFSLYKYMNIIIVTFSFSFVSILMMCMICLFFINYKAIHFSYKTCRKRFIISWICLFLKTEIHVAGDIRMISDLSESSVTWDAPLRCKNTSEKHCMILHYPGVYICSFLL